MRPTSSMLSSSSSSSSLPLPFSFAPNHYPHPQPAVSLGRKKPLSHIIEPCTSEDTRLNQVSVPKPKTIRHRLGHLCREGQPQVALNLFDTIPQPTTVLWNTIIIGFVCNDMPQEAISFYSRMRHSGSSKCDPYTFSAALKACAETRSLRIGKALHCHVLRSSVYPNRIVGNSLLNMYASCLSSESASTCDLVKRVFDTMRGRNVVTWNTMISWYVKTMRPVEAFRHFVLMMKFGVRPTPVSFVNLFPAVSALGDVKIANGVYGLLVKFGNEYFNDLFVVSSAIFMFTELRCLDLAKRIFDKCLERNTEVWNSIIGCYVQNNCPFEALDMFIEALSAGDTIVLDDVTFLSALAASSQLQQLSLGQQLHGYLIKISKDSCVILLNATIAMYSKCNCITDSFKVFDKMLERDIVSWNTMISALVQNGLDDEGLMLVYEMQREGFTIDEVTITALLSAASNIRDLETGKQVHAYILRKNVKLEGLETYLIDMYAKSGMIKAAEEIFKLYCTNDRDPATWNAMIAGNTQNGLIEHTFLVFREMLELNVTPNAVTIASILPACSQSGSLATGKQLHCFAIRYFFDDNVFVNSALVDMYSKCGAIHYAETVFVKSTLKNSVTYTNMILGYGQHGMADKAVRLFYSLRESGVNPDAIAFVAVLSGCSYAGLVDEGLQIMELMHTEYGLKPSIEHYACVVDMLGRAGRLFEAYNFVKDMGEEGNVLGIWGSLLSACRVHRNFELGKVVANKLLEMEADDMMSGYHVLLSNIYAEEGHWQIVNNVRRVMQEKGLLKEVGCSWIDISGYAHCFASRDRKHPLCNEIYEMLEILVNNMKDAGYRPYYESW